MVDIGNSAVGPLSPGQSRARIELFTVKNSRRVQSISQGLLHFSMSYNAFWQGYEDFLSRFLQPFEPISEIYGYYLDIVSPIYNHPNDSAYC